MKIQNIPIFKNINSEKLKINFFDTGDIFNIVSNENQINLLRGNTLDGTVSNVFMRVTCKDKMKTTPLIGSKSISFFTIKNNKAIYKGVFQDVYYQLEISIETNRILFNIEYKSNIKRTVEFFYGQDIGLNPSTSIMQSEAYTVQYIDYKVFNNEDGYILCARQNQGSSSYFQIGCDHETSSFSTDGFQFFGKEYKHQNYPSAYDKLELDNEIYQYEFSYLALKTKAIDIEKQTKTIAFYGLYKCDYQSKINNFYDIHFNKHRFEIINEINNENKSLLDRTTIINGDLINEDQIRNYFTEFNHEEYNKNTLLSFFTKNHHHVVMAQKELLVERQHGNILISGDILKASEKVMATTNFIYGVFNSHIVIGNTTFNKFLGDLRNPLNLLKISGQRIYIKIDGTYKILGLPSFYEMGTTVSRWFYSIKNEIIEVKVFVDINKTNLVLEFNSSKKYDIIVTHQILLGSEEHQHDVEYYLDNNEYTFKPNSKSMVGDKYPNLTYKLKTLNADVIDELTLLGLNSNQGLFILEYKKTNTISLKISSSIDGKYSDDDITYNESDKQGTLFYRSILNNLNVISNDEKINKLTDILYWYTHNALVHYASPHGLEQHNGAAWGTRDVCQGPAELFIAAGRFDIVREIILKIYKRQFLETGDFPQWFMFDKYYSIQAHESHGDIIIWPLYLLSYYLKYTNDLDILNEKVEYMSLEKNEFTSKTTLFDHVKHQIESIKSTFIQNTSLVRYGGGDWDDTLQPANQELKNKMVSGWTIALLYETFKLFSEQVNKVNEEYSNNLSVTLNNIKNDYNKYIVNEDIPSGFIVFDKENKLLIHPNDKETGISYRLLPFIRSMISSITPKENLEKYTNIITNHLKHPDGVRLMDKTVYYHGGEKTFFQRAETAANFGREIGLQYCHAHIRYIQAMYQIGNIEAGYNGFYEINPININDTVPNALTRQSNMYFSSSDACFKTRYEAQNNFDKLKKGEINVKGGWRLYSSGPGIYIHQVISNLLGISQINNSLFISPNSYKIAKINQINYHYKSHKLKINILKGKENISVGNNQCNITKIYNNYTFKGYLIEFLNDIDKDITINITI